MKSPSSVAAAVLLLLLAFAPGAEARALPTSGVAPALTGATAPSSSKSKRKQKRSAKKQPAKPAAPQEAAPEAAPPAAPPPAAQSDAPRATAQSAEPSSEPSSDPSMDFELLEPASAAAPVENPALAQAVSRRRTMLSLHQGLGLGMAGGLVATTLVGQANFNDRYRGGGDDGTWKTLHRGLVVGTSALFATVAVMGVLAPEPYPKPLRFDTLLMHKIFMSLATAGMVTQVVLGLITASTAQEGQVSQVRFATAHQVVGYATLGFTSAGVLTLLLP